MKKFWENPANSTVAPQGAQVPDSLQFGNVCIAPATILAPMAGVTDTVFRRFIRNASFVRSAHDVMAVPEDADGDIATSELHQVQNSDGHEQKPSAVFEKSACGLLMTEFTSADGLFRTRESKRKRYLTFYEDEHPISAQLFGSDPYTLAESAKIVEDAGFDLVDLNLGCPAKRVVKCNGGSGLLKDLPVIGTIFESVRAAVKIPFTVKFRLGWDNENIVCVPLAKMAEDCGLNGVALHARTREQGYSGNARWEWIAAVKDAVKIPVVGNGDIRTPEDAIAMVAQTGCDGVMIGRTAASNPWIFRQIRQHAETGRYDQPTEADRYEMIRTYFKMLVDETMHGSPGKMKQFVAWFTHGIPGGNALRRACYDAHTGPAILASVERFFEELLSGNAAEEPPAVAEAEMDLLSACD
ncbi:MAG TPA: tRNA dihydrouridine synthase DusB [Candidatus Acidoferrales bacterium]|nr:tRNA dihydrouridine synthase DusB [Candidatus Acidoferrales bacterium]